MAFASFKKDRASSGADGMEAVGELAPPPVHVAIIMDGNGRWAKARGLPRTAGHKRGADAVRASVESAVKQGIRYLTLYGFSSENWRRPLEEVNDLMGLLRVYLRKEIKFLDNNGVRFRVIGDRSQLAEDIQTLIKDAEAQTRANAKLELTIALSYGGRDEITRAARALAADAAAGKLDPATIDEDLFASRLYTADLPDPDLLIRTSGEQRISNFLPWQLAYAEFVFLPVYWPDFNHDQFVSAVADYRRRDRRYGTTSV